MRAPLVSLAWLVWGVCPGVGAAAAASRPRTRILNASDAFVDSDAFSDAFSTARVDVDVDVDVDVNVDRAPAVFTVVNASLFFRPCCATIPSTCACEDLFRHGFVSSHILQDCPSLVRTYTAPAPAPAPRLGAGQGVAKGNAEPFARRCHVGRLGWGCSSGVQVQVCVFACAPCAAVSFTLAHVVEPEGRAVEIRTLHDVRCGPHDDTCARSAAQRYALGARFAGTYARNDPYNVTLGSFLPPFAHTNLRVL
jgi:hypothetical protein